MVRSSVRPIVCPIVRPFVRPNNLCSVVMLPKFWSFIRSIIRSFVHTTIHHYYSTLLFIIVTIHKHYSPSLLFVVTIHRHYSSSLLFINAIYNYFFRRYYLSLLFIERPITPNFNYSSIMLSSPPKTSQTNIPVIRTPVTVIFLRVRTSHLVTHHKFLQVEHA
jgi:hypothetical protein